MLTIKGMLGLGSGLLLVNGVSPLIPTLFLSLIFPYSSAALLPQVGLLLGLSRHSSSYCSFKSSDHPKIPVSSKPL